MRVLVLFILSSASTLQAMEQESPDSTFLRRVSLVSVSARNDVVITCNSLLKRFQLTPPSSPDLEPLCIELADSRSTSPLVLGEAIIGKRIPDSPPKSPLEQEAVVGDLIPEKPTLFRITNKTLQQVIIHVILSEPYRAKKYVFGPNDSMIMLSPDAAHVCFEEVHLPHQEGRNTHLVRYSFTDALFARLVIQQDPYAKTQLKIIKMGSI